MKIKNLIMTTVLALAGAALIETSASAQVITSTGDLVLGFQITDNAGTGATTDLEVDLGAYSNFTTLEGSGSVLNLNVGGVVDSGLGGLSATDLSSTYGAGWNSRTDLTWSVFGTRGNPSKESFLSSPSGATLNDETSTPLGNLSGKMGTVVTNLNGQAQTANSATASTALQTSTVGSYTFQITGNNAFTSDWNNGGSVGGTQQGVSSAGATSLELFDLTNHSSSTPGIEVGTFTLGSNGSLTFTATSAVPEPSTYALMGVGAFMLMLVMRRRVLNV
jgi:hypothetical protein